MLEALEYIFLLNDRWGSFLDLAIFSWNFIGWGLDFWFYKVEDSVRKRSLVWRECHVNHGFVRGGCVCELYHLLSLFVKVFVDPSVLSNRLLLVDKLANVNASGTCVFLNEVSEVLKVII